MQKIIKAQFGAEMQDIMSSFNLKNKDDQERGNRVLSTYWEILSSTF